MGLFDFFGRRRERESATAGLDAADPRQAEVAPAAEWDEGGQATDEIPAGGPDLAELGQIGALIAHAAREGTIQVHQGEPQSVDLSDTGLREDVLGILQRYGIDAEARSDG